MNIVSFIVLISISFLPFNKFGIIGEWSGSPDGKTNVTYIFNKDGSLVWKINGSQSIVAKYKIDWDSEIKQIDIFDFESKELNGWYFEGIFKIIDNDKIKFYGSQIPPGNKRFKRPSSFGKDSIILERKK